MIDLNFTVNGNQLTRGYPFHKISGNSANDLRCHFSFGSNDLEDSITRLAIFKSMSFNITKLATIASDGTCMIPWEVVCKPGVIICSVSCVDSEGAKVVTNPVKVILITDFASDDVTYSNSPTASEFEQFVRDIQNTIGEFIAAQQLQYDSLGGIPTLEGVSIEGDLFITDFGYELASIADIDNMFE